ncbi:MAG: FecR domain-containing protein [Acidobacteriia bacterium]|nr:FecR domain-containing protein [Terriglobia bacterium]
MNRAGFALALATTLLLAAGPARAQAEDPEAYGDDYQQGDYGRIRSAENGATIDRSQPDSGGRPGDGSATVNAPVFPGDTIRTGRDQRVEIQLASGALLRQDDDSEMTYVSLPRPGAEFQDNTVLRLSSGAVRIVGVVGEKETFRLDTPAASVYVLGDADVRVDVVRGGSTKVLSHRGVVEVVGEGGSVLVRGGMRSAVDAGSIPSDPRAFNTFASDGFDRWCDGRDDAYRVRSRSAGSPEYDPDAGYGAVPGEVRPYYHELSSYGRWVDAPTYGWVWYPYDVAPGWRPYNDGYWDYGPGGYFWVANEPWGWAPYHYGRWNWVSGFGWCWAPGRVFGGAWVSWAWGSAYVGWAPLDFWGRPAFVGSLWYDYYDPACWTFVGFNHFGGRDYRRWAVPIDRLGPDLHRMAVVTRPPRFSPRGLASDPSVRERAARVAMQDRAAHVRPIVRDRVPDTRFRAVEDRLIERDRKQARPGAGPVGARPVAPGPRRSVGVSEIPRSVSPTAGSSGRGSRNPSYGDESGSRRPRVAAAPPAGRERSQGNGAPEPERWQRSRSPNAEQQQAPGVQEPARGRRGQDGGNGYARRILKDPLAEERARQPKPHTDRPAADRDTRDRVRDMYQHLARPRETGPREVPRDVRPSPPSPRYEPPTPRVERRASPPATSPPRVERPRSQPTPQSGQDAGRARPKEKEKKR